MKLAARYDIEAPVDFAYRAVTDFEAWQHLAAQRGASVTRKDPPGGPGQGSEWQVSFPFRAKTRNATLHLVTASPTSQMTVSASSKLVDGEVTVELLNLGANRTRIEVRLEARPKTLAARIYVQTLRLARKKLEANFSKRVAQFAADLEDSYRRPSAR